MTNINTKGQKYYY